MDVHVGNVIRELLAKKRITQVELCKKIGFTKQGINTVLNKSSVKTELIDKISSALGVNIYQIIANQIEGVEKYEPTDRITLTFNLEKSKIKSLLKIIES